MLRGLIGSGPTNRTDPVETSSYSSLGDLSGSTVRALGDGRDSRFGHPVATGGWAMIRAAGRNASVAASIACGSAGNSHEQSSRDDSRRRRPVLPLLLAGIAPGP